MKKTKTGSLTEQGAQDLSTSDEVSAFLDAVKDMPLAASGSDRGKLILALDATASRQPTWNQAMTLTGDMFTHARGIGMLDVQLVYYRGFDECRSSRWLSSADKLVGLMRKVSCMAGRTQIKRVLKHALAETRGTPVQAVVFIGDCVEEDIDELGNLAGQAKLLNLPLFIFQEGHNGAASSAFAQLARLSGGAHCRFDESSAQQLGDLLNAVAVYATGGKQALQRLAKNNAGQASLLLKQLS